MTSMTLNLHHTAKQKGQSIATIFGERKKTWTEVLDRVARFAAALKDRGVKPGDRVAILAYNSDIYFEYYLAVPWVGAVVVPLNIRWTVSEIAYAIENSGSQILLVDENFSNMAQDIQAECPDIHDIIYIGDDIACDGLLDLRNLMADCSAIEDVGRDGDDLFGIFYTSGTTALPKGVMLSHENIWTSSLSVAAKMGFEADDIYLHCAPMFHMADATHGFATFLSSVTHSFIECFTPDSLLDVIGQDRITHIILIPTMIAVLLENPHFTSADLSSLKFLESGAAPLSPDLLRRTMEALPDVGIFQGYGQTEMAPAISVLSPEDYIIDGAITKRSRSVGRAVDCVQAKIATDDGEEMATGDMGEIWARGPNVMLGYYNMPDETAKTLVNGWIRTGDAGYMDEGGYIFLVDRFKDIIITGGENVSSLEVEDVINAHPSVFMCAVIGLPDDIWGERVHAVITRHQDTTLSKEEIILYCKDQLGGYKCPRSVNISIDPLPLSGAGKIMKRKLKESYLAKNPVTD